MKVTATILREVSPKELQALLRVLIREEFAKMNDEIQRALGEDDLISTGSACRLLGVSNKVFKYLLDEGHFTVYYHLKERRFNRGEILAWRNKRSLRKKK